MHPLDQPMPPSVLAHRADDRTGSMLFLHNLDDRPARVDLGHIATETDHPNQVFGDEHLPQLGLPVAHDKTAAVFVELVAEPAQFRDAVEDMLINRRRTTPWLAPPPCGRFSRSSSTR